MSCSHLIAGLVGTASAIDNFDCPDVSCKGRCGSILSSDSQALLCSCDKKCVMFGDCCRDFYDVCPNIQSPPSFTYNHGHVSCLQLPIKTQANKVRPSNHFFLARQQACLIDWYADLQNIFFLLAPCSLDLVYLVSLPVLELTLKATLQV